MTTTMQQMDERVAGAVAFVLAACALAFANFTGGSDANGGAAEYAVTLGVCAVVAAVLFGRVLPRTEQPGKVALWCAVLAVLFLAAFWSGLSIVLGAGAMVAGTRSGRTPAVVAGGLAIVAAIVACVLG